MCEILHSIALKDPNLTREDRKKKQSEMNVFDFDKFTTEVILNVASLV